MRKRTFISVFILFLSFVLLLSCKSPLEPSMFDDEETISDQWEPRIKVVYNRDVSLIRDPDAYDIAMLIEYKIYDTKAIEHENSAYEEVLEGYRVGSFGAPLITKTAENRFEMYIEKVQVHTKEKYSDHTITMSDPKFSDGGNDWMTRNTGKGITIELENSNNIVIITAVSTFKMYFRIIDPSIVMVKKKWGRGIF